MVVGYHHFRKPPFSDTAVAMSPCLAYFFVKQKNRRSGGVMACHELWMADKQVKLDLSQFPAPLRFTRHWCHFNHMKKTDSEKRKQISLASMCKQKFLLSSINRWFFWDVQQKNNWQQLSVVSPRKNTMATTPELKMEEVEMVEIGDVDWMEDVGWVLNNSRKKGECFHKSWMMHPDLLLFFQNWRVEVYFHVFLTYSWMFHWLYTTWTLGFWTPKLLGYAGKLVNGLYMCCNLTSGVFLGLTTHWS